MNRLIREKYAVSSSESRRLKLRYSCLMNPPNIRKRMLHFFWPPRYTHSVSRTIRTVALAPSPTSTRSWVSKSRVSKNLVLDCSQSW